MSLTAENGKREGRRRKIVELTLVEKEQAEFLLIARRKLVELLRVESHVTIEDLREQLTIPASVRGVMLGAIPKALVRAGVICRTGFAETSRPTSHSRPVSVWTLNDAAAASKWMADNPAPAPVTPPTVQRELFDDRSSN